MEFTAGKADLLKELNLLQGVVERKNTIPILSNIMVESDGESGIRLVATDLDVSLETYCDAKVSQPGSVVLQARKLFEIARSLSDSEIVVKSEENDWVKISSGGSKFRMVGHPREHFPSTPRSEQALLSLTSAQLNNLISKTLFAVTQEESRYSLAGSLFLLSGGKLDMAATDGHRLALASCKAEDTGSEVRVIIPKKALAELLRVTAGNEEPVQFAKDDNHLYFTQNRRLLTSRMLTGQFPNYPLVIPQNNDKRLALDVDQLTQVIRRASLMSDDRTHQVKMKFGDGTLTVSAQSADLGESTETMPIDYPYEDLIMAFNAFYLLDVLSAVGTQQIVLSIKDEKTPALIKPGEEGEMDYIFVVMPMRV